VRRAGGVRAAALAWLFALAVGCGGPGLQCDGPVATDRPDGGADDGGATADGGHDTGAQADAGGDAGPPTDGGGDGGGADPCLADLAALRALVQALPGAGSAAARDALITGFFTAVAYGECGFPIRAEGQLGVAVRIDGGGSFTLAGDFNGWNASALPLLQPVAGFHFYYLITPITEPLPRTLYKVVRNGSEWLADPMARRFGWDGNGQFSLAEAGTAVSHLERWPGFAEGLGTLQPRDVVVYVPAGNPALPRPVLYLHDGQNLFDPDAMWGGWNVGETADTLIGNAQMRAILIVGVYNTSDRMDEYTHTTDDIGGGTIVGGRADEYLDFLVHGVKPFVEARYTVATGAASTGVLGSSLGGLVSVYAAVSYPAVFGFAGSMSGSFFWGEGLGHPTMASLVDATPPTGVAFYLDSGGDDTCPGGGDNYCENVALANVLRAHGWTDGTSLRYVWAPNAQHNEAAWAARLPGALRSWYPGP
jgi:predicted alpha/beta superfamily hydrolase